MRGRDEELAAHAGHTLAGGLTSGFHVINMCRRPADDDGENNMPRRILRLDSGVDWPSVPLARVVGNWERAKKKVLVPYFRAREAHAGMAPVAGRNGERGLKPPTAPTPRADAA